MLIRRLKVSGLLSFGPRGVDLPLEPLNVLIGPNGAGKSNLLEVLALLRAAPTGLAAPVKQAGGVGEWLWKMAPPLGAWSDKSRTEASTTWSGSGRAVVDVILSPQGSDSPIRHVIEFTDHGGRFEVMEERIEKAEPYADRRDAHFFYRFRKGRPEIRDITDEPRALQPASLMPEESILSQVRDPERYPVLHRLQEQYARIGLYRSWTFGPGAGARQAQSAHGRSDALNDAGANLVPVLSKMPGTVKRELIRSLSELFDGIEDVRVTVDGGNVLLFLEERGGREVPATRLSDGTLRYLSLLVLLLHPEPPPLVAIDEPELGLHPDVLPHVAELLVQASSRMQLVVTTHSRMLVDALTEHPSSVIVCERENGESQFERLDPEPMQAWLDEYSLGALWGRGAIGGNRW